MSISEKIALLRRGKGWSQEELAERMEVSRQAVSKWESGQSAPELDKLPLLSDLLGVTTDYLLRDGAETPQMETAKEALPILNGEEAAAYLQCHRETAPQVALGVLLCVLSPAALIVLSGLGEDGSWRILAGLLVLLGFVAWAVTLFIRAAGRMAPYDWLKKEAFMPGRGVEELARSAMEDQREANTRRLTLGVVLILLSAVPVVAASLLTDNALLILIAVALLLALAGMGSALLVWGGLLRESCAVLLQRDDYAPEHKKNAPLISLVGGIYWTLIIALFLGYSLITGDWGRSWIIWPVAGLLFVPIVLLTEWKEKKK